MTACGEERDIAVEHQLDLMVDDPHIATPGGLTSVTAQLQAYEVALTAPGAHQAKRRPVEIAAALAQLMHLGPEMLRDAFEDQPWLPATRICTPTEAWIISATDRGTTCSRVFRVRRYHETQTRLFVRVK